jgi:hypothetical protein
MAWWAWLLVLWPLVAISAAVLLATALRRSDQLDWVRRGSPDRRAASRESAYGVR